MLPVEAVVGAAGVVPKGFVLSAGLDDMLKSPPPGTGVVPDNGHEVD